MRKLEEKAAEYESKMHKREEEFRKMDNERMKKFFAARFDNIPGAFVDSDSHGGMSALQSSRQQRGFRDDRGGMMRNS